MSDTRGVFIVIPAYNEGPAVGDAIADAARFVDPPCVIVVDDASTDDTGSIAAQHGATVLRHAVNRGQGAALATGIAAALRLGAQIVVTFDADGQHRASDLPAMIQPIQNGEADVVLGSRFIGENKPDIPPIRRLVLRLAIIFTRYSSGIDVTDTHNGYRALSRKAAEQLRIRQDRMAHASEILDRIVRNKLKYVERPVSIRYTEYSLAKGQRNRDAFKLLLRVIFNKVTS
jgi:glycosyltransferase involved in cell wall biosynthesis